MARLALTIAGGIIGALIAGPGAIALGWSIGAMLGGVVGQLAFPGKGTHVYGPRLNDLSVASSAPGMVIPLLFGTMRLGAQIIWSSGIKEVTTNTKQHAGKGGPSVSQTTYTYFVSFAAAFCQGPATVTRVWGDAKLIYDITGKGQIAKNITVIPTKHTGSETQLADPVIVAAQGANVTPAYRGVCYCVWSQFPLADFGNRLPNIRAEVTAQSVPAPATSDMGWPLSTGIFTNVYPAKCCATEDGSTAWATFPLYGGGSPGQPKIARFDIASNALVAQGQIDFTTVPGFNPAADFPNATIVVDSQGNLWTTGFQNFYTPIGSNTAMMYKVDPWTFKCIKGVPLKQVGAIPIHFAPFQINGVPHLACMSNVSNWSGFNIDGWTMYVLRCTDGVIIGQYPLFPTDIPKYPGDSTASILTRYVHAACDDSTGNIYICFGGKHSTGNQYDSYIWKINAAGGINSFFVSPGAPTNVPVFTSVTKFSYPTGNYALDGQLQIILFDPSDKTLIGFTDAGQIQKIDVNSGVVLQRVGDSSNPQYKTTFIGVLGGSYGYAGGNTGGQFNGMASDNGESLLGKSLNGKVQQGIFLTRSGDTGVFGPPEWSGQAVQRWNASDLSKVNPTPDYLPNWPSVPSATLLEGTFLAQSNSFLVGYQTIPGLFLRLYLDRVSTTGFGADAIVSQICTNAGIDPANVDTTPIAGLSIIGYPIAALTTGKDLINNLGQALFFEGRETDFKLQFIPRGQPPILTIPETDLGLIGDNSKLEEGVGQEQDLPKTVEIMYFDSAQDYQQGKQHKIRHHKTTKTVNFTSISLPLVMTAQQAAALADRILWTAEAERRTYKFNVWKGLYMLLDPADVISFVFDGVQLSGRVVNCTAGQNFATLLELNSEDSNNYISVQAGNPSTGFTPQTLPPLSGTQLFILDMPLLRDQDVDAAGNLGYYAFMAPSGGGTWGAGVLYQSTDGNSFSQVDAVTQSVAYGIAQTALGDTPRPYSWDYKNTLTVKMVQGANPTSDTVINVLNGSNAAILYPSLEVIQFTTATVNGDGTVTLGGGLLRGRRGTEWATAGHTSGEYVFFPLEQPGGVLHEQLALGTLNVLRYYKGVTNGADISTGYQQGVTLIGRDLMPYAPEQLKGTRS